VTVTREQAAKLTHLYEKRQDLQRARELAADRNFWIGIANEAFWGTGTRSMVMSKLGGAEAYATLMLRVVPDRFEELQRALDTEIEQNGGQP
jgi:hypothetical protein